MQMGRVLRQRTAAARRMASCASTMRQADVPELCLNCTLAQMMSPVYTADGLDFTLLHPVQWNGRRQCNRCGMQAPSRTDAEAGGQGSEVGQASVDRRPSRPQALPNGVVGFKAGAKEHGTGADAAAQSRAEPAPAQAESQAERAAAGAEPGGDRTPQQAADAAAHADSRGAAGAGGGSSNTPFDDIPSLLRSAPNKRPDLAGSGGRTPSLLGPAAPVFGPGGSPGADLPVTFGTRRLRFAEQATPQLLRSHRGDRPVAGRNSTPYPAAAGARPWRRRVLHAAHGRMAAD